MAELPVTSKEQFSQVTPIDLSDFRAYVNASGLYVEFFVSGQRIVLDVTGARRWAEWLQRALAASSDEPPPALDIPEVHLIPEVEEAWEMVIDTCRQAWPDKQQLAYSQSPTELIVDIINERDELKADLEKALANHTADLTTQPPPPDHKKGFVYTGELHIVGHGGIIYGQWVRAEDVASQPPDLGLSSAATPAARDVLSERWRQKNVEGWTPEHDDQHNTGDLALAAACYVVQDAPNLPKRIIDDYWPWGSEWWKPKDKRRNLVRAAALLIAEIERIDRAASRPTKRDSHGG